MISDKSSGNLLGTALLTIGEGAHVDLAGVSYLAVDPTFQGRGLGRDLMRYAENRAKTTHRKVKILLTVVYHPLHTQEQLVQWYLGQGYQYIRNSALSQENKKTWFEPEFHELVQLKVFDKNL